MRARPAIDADALAALSVPRVGPWLRAAAIDWAVIAVVFVAVARLDHPLAYALAVIPLGSRQQALGALFHDASHRLITRRRRWNDVLGSVLAAWPLGLTLGGYRRYHIAHHDGLGTPRDPELTHKSTLRQWRLPASPLAVLRDFASDLVGGGLPHLVAAGRLTRPVSLAETAGIATFWLAVFGAAWELHVLWIPLLWIAAVATVFWSGVRLRIWTEHLGTLGTHRISVPWWLGHLIMPHDIGLHWEHHHFPGVPFWNLSRVRALVAGPCIPLPALAHAFLTSASVPSGAIAETIDENAATTPDAVHVARARRTLRMLRFALHVGAPLVAGVLVYVGFREELPRALAWVPFGGFLRGYLPERFVEVFPDAAWAYALTALLALVWSDDKHGWGRAWIWGGPLLAAGWELGQWAHVVPGTFDVADLVFGLAASFVAMVTCGSTAPLLSLPSFAYPPNPPPKGP